MTHKINIAQFETIVSKYQAMVFRTAMGFVHSKEDAEDLTQEVFIRAYNSWNTFRGDAQVTTWLYRITINLSLNHIEQQRKQSILGFISNTVNNMLNQKSEDKTPHQLLEETELKQEIKKAIDTLPDKQRTAFVLSKYEELSQKEIAKIMETTEGSVEQLLQRAKSNLQKILSKTVGKR